MPSPVTACSADTIVGRVEFSTIPGDVALRVGVLRAGPRSRGTVLVLPGRSEFIEKYLEFAGTVVGWGYDAAIIDWRGQGGSSRLLPYANRGHVEDFGDFLDDLARLLQHLAEQGLAPPRSVIAHSMGGHIALRALIEGRLRVEGAVLLTPMLGIAFEPLPGWFARLVSGAAVRLGHGDRYAPSQGDRDASTYRFEGNRVTSDHERYVVWRRLLDDHPQHRLGGVTYGWLKAALASIDRLKRSPSLDSLDLPILVALAERERIVSNRAIEEVAARLPGARLLRFPGAEHDLLWEAEATRTRLLQEIERFLAGL
jgi:lysophospholipase